MTDARRRTIRTTFAVVVGLAAMAPVLVQATGLHEDDLPWLGTVVAVCAAITRVMALPAVEVFLRRYVPWLAADVDTPQRGLDDLPWMLGHLTRMETITNAGGDGKVADEDHTDHGRTGE